MEMLPNVRASRSVKAITCGETPGKVSMSPVNVAPTAWSTNSHEASPDPAWIAANAFDVMAPARYNSVVANKLLDKESLCQQVQAIGSLIADQHRGELLFSVLLTGAQLLQVCGFDDGRPSRMLALRSDSGPLSYGVIVNQKL